VRFDGNPNAIPVSDADATSFKIADHNPFTEPERNSDGFAKPEPYNGSA